MQEEAKFLKEMILFDQLLKDMRYMSNYQMFQHATNYDDLIFGKACLWTLEIMENKVNQLLKLK